MKMNALPASLCSLALAACSASSTSLPPSNASSVTGATSSGLASRLVGVGDSLVAGQQSGALLGATIAANPIAGSPFPLVPNTQGHGFYARVWSQANGGLDPLAFGTSPLPLIAPPGIGTQGSILVPTSGGSLTPLAPPCAGNDIAAFSFSSALSVRLNPQAKPLNVAVPGQTLHEVLFQTQPTGPCSGSSLPAAFAGLNSVVNSENLNFYPVLANFGQNVTQAQAAVSLQPTLALVWVGSNDLLKYAVSNGGVQAATAAAFQSDMTQLLSTLQSTGAKVAVANLVDVLGTAFFTPAAALPQVLAAKGVPSPLQAPLAAGIGSFLQGFGVGAGGYLTLSGAQKILGVLQAALPAIQGGASASSALSAGFSQLQASSNAFGAGDFVSDTVAANVKALNASYNQAIASVAAQRGAALVDIAAPFAQAEQASNEVMAVTGKCCSLLYGGGFFSLDGLHPSDTGYAVIANLFIAAIDQTYGATIPALSSTQIATINASDLYSPH